VKAKRSVDVIVRNRTDDEQGTMSTALVHDRTLVTTVFDGDFAQ